MTTTTRSATLRKEREAAGLSRVQLAGLAECSLAQLASIEQGAIPTHSQVLGRIEAALKKHCQQEKKTK